MVEAAIIFPCLILIIYWSAALTDVMVLKLKAAEALRYSLWESTVFKAPSQIDSEVQQKFVDLRSPKSINISYTGLLMYPLARDMAWKANVDMSSTTVSLGGSRAPPPSTNGILDKIMNAIANALSKAVDPTMKFFKFNTNGEAVATVTLVHARHDEQASPILKGGDLLGLKGGNDLDHPTSMTNFTFRAPLPSERPMKLIFDTWKAWPKPAAYTKDGGSTNVNEPPSRTYPVVEDMVSAQEKKVAFFGLTGTQWFGQANTIMSKILGNSIIKMLVGGSLPLWFDASRMDSGSTRGPITILPPEGLGNEPGFVPKTCVINNRNTTCPSQRIGDLTSGSGPKTFNPDDSLGDNVDHTRYTLPYKVNTEYWRKPGGMTFKYDDTSAALTPLKAKLASRNEYVLTYQCRGHFFAGATKAQQSDPSARYQRSCNK